MAAAPPSVIVLAGPNGAGKSTAAPAFLQKFLGLVNYVNADVIARGLSGFGPDTAALAASEIMLRQLDELARRHVSFSFETTLASRSLARRLSEMLGSGFEFHLIFLWLRDAGLAVRRVKRRVRVGGAWNPRGRHSPALCSRAAEFLSALLATGHDLADVRQLRPPGSAVDRRWKGLDNGSRRG